MDGWEFLGRIKQMPALAHIPVVIISFAAENNKGIALGATAVLQKPVSREALNRVLVDIEFGISYDKKPPKILIVDDEPEAVDLIAANLRGSGYTVLYAYGGCEAIEMIHRHLPDLILLDLLMPGMDGFSVVTTLKADPATKSIPIIIITALEDRNSKLRALNEGAEEFFIKPIDRVELLVRVRNLLRLKEYSDFLDTYSRTLEAQVQERAAELQAGYLDTIHTLVRAAEYKDEETGGHVKRISYYCQGLAVALGNGQRVCVYHFPCQRDACRRKNRHS